MTLSYKMVSGTVKEPLYVLGFNGYYQNNDTSSESNLTTEGASLKTEQCDDYEVVTDVVMPLTGGLSQYYYNNCYLYVPAMKNLNGTISGVNFDAGKFNVKTTITLYWDTLTKVSGILEDGIYAIDGQMLKVDKRTASMSDSAITHTMKLTVKDGAYSITMNYKGMNISGLFGYLDKLYYYETGYTQDGAGNPKGTKKAVTVDSVQKYTDGTVVKDDFGTNYPDIVTFEVIPEADEDGYIPLQVYVPIMEAISAGSGTQDVYLKVDWSTVTKTTANDSVFSKEDTVQDNPAAKPSTSQPSTTQPSTTKPSTTQPSTTQPTTTQPSTTQPSTTQPTTAKPSTTQPAVTQTVKKNQKVAVSGVTYQVTATGKNATAKFVKTTSKKAKVSIPSRIKVGNVTLTVTAIGDSAFKNNKTMTAVSIPATVKTIGKSAFANCAKLKSVTIPKSVTSIGTSAFSGCKKLTKVTLGASVKTIGATAFQNCTGLKSITISKNVTIIGKNAFKGAKNLKTVTIAAPKLKSIGKGALKTIHKKAVIKFAKTVSKKQKTSITKKIKKSGIVKTVKVK